MEKLLYRGICTELENQIFSGQIAPGQKLPSVRILSARYGVNPNTVGRAVRELQKTGLVISLRGCGTIVTDDDQIILNWKHQRVRLLMKQFFNEMEGLGYTRTMVLDELQRKGTNCTAV